VIFDCTQNKSQITIPLNFQQTYRIFEQKKRLMSIIFSEGDSVFTANYPTGKMSEEEFRAFCAANPDLRIEQDQDQNVIVMPPTHGDSGFYEKQAIVRVGNYELNYKTGVSFSSSTGFKLPNGATRSPDACWISMECWSTLTVEDKQDFLPVVPDFVIEIRSSSDTLKKLQDKMQEWIDNGVRLAWLIDPKKQQVTIYRENSEPEIVEGFENILSGEEVMPGFEFDLKLLQLP